MYQELKSDNHFKYGQLFIESENIFLFSMERMIFSDKSGDQFPSAKHVH